MNAAGQPSRVRNDTRPIGKWDTTNINAEVFVYGFSISSSAAPAGAASRNVPEHKQ